MLACDILDIIIDMEINVRVSKLTQQFKKEVNEVDSAHEIQNQKKIIDFLQNEKAIANPLKPIN